MQIGLFHLPILADDGQPDYQGLLRECRAADESGWHHVWLAEHHFDAYGGEVPCSAVLAAAVLAVTRRIRVGSAVVVLPLADARAVAEQWGMLDHLGRGRVDLGIGRGFIPHELAAAGLAPEQRSEAFLRGLRTLDELWGSPGSADPCRVAPRVTPAPLQQPHPPIWMAASTSRDSFELAGTRGFHLMLNPYTRTDEELGCGLGWYHAAFAAAGHAHAPRVLMNAPVFVSSSDGRAREDARAYFERYLAAANASFARNNPGFRAMATFSYERLCDDRLLFGTPRTVAERLLGWAQRFGATDFSLMTRFGGIDVSRSVETIDAVAHDLLPSLQPA